MTQQPNQQVPTNIPPPKQTEGWFPGTLRPVTKTWRALTFNSPLVGAAVLGGGLGLLGYHFAPKLSKLFNRITSPIFGGKAEDENEEVPWSKSDRRDFGITLGSLGALGILAGSFSPDSPGYGVLQYDPMDKRESAGENPIHNPLHKEAVGLFDSISLGDAADLIKSDPNMDVGTKLDALSLLSSFDAPPTTQVNGGNIVGQAIATGKDAAFGGALGFLTAKAIGLPNPKSTAILGAISNTLGVMPALATSLIFGH